MGETLTSPINYDLKGKEVPSADNHEASAEIIKNKLVEESSDRFMEKIPGGRHDEDTELLEFEEMVVEDCCECEHIGVTE